MNLFSSMSVRSFAQVLALKKRMSMGGSISERIMVWPPLQQVLHRAAAQGRRRVCSHRTSHQRAAHDWDFLSCRWR